MRTATATRGTRTARFAAAAILGILYTFPRLRPGSKGVLSPDEGALRGVNPAGLSCLTEPWARL